MATTGRAEADDGAEVGEAVAALRLVAQDGTDAGDEDASDESPDDGFVPL